MGTATDRDDDMNISDDEEPTYIETKKAKPRQTGEYHWKKLTFSTCDGTYRWFHYDTTHNLFAQEHTQGKWYLRNLETSEFQDFDWVKHAAPEDPEQNKALHTQRQLEYDEPVLYVQMSADAAPSLDSYQRPAYKFNSYGQPLVPRNEELEPVFPCDANKVPLFPYNYENQHQELLYNEDGVPVVPLNDEGKAIVPLDHYGMPVFPLDPTGNLIWPIDDEGMPYPPLNPQGVPAIRCDENGLPIVPHDENGEQMIFFDKDGIPMKMTEFREKFTKEETLKWGGGHLPPQLALPPPPIPDPIVNPYDFTDPATVMTEAPPDIDANIPVLQLPEIPPEYAQAMAIHARGLSGKFKMEYELEWKYFAEELQRRQAEAIRIYNEECEKYMKTQKADEERRKRLGKFLKINTGKLPALPETTEVKKSAEQLKEEIEAKRQRLREEEEKKKIDALKEVEKYVEPHAEKEERRSGSRSPSERYGYQKPYYRNYRGDGDGYRNDRDGDGYRNGRDRDDLRSWKFNPKHRQDNRRGGFSGGYQKKYRSRSRSVERKRKSERYSDSEEERPRKRKNKKRQEATSESESTDTDYEKLKKKKKSKKESKHKKEKRHKKHHKKESSPDISASSDDTYEKLRRRSNSRSKDSPRVRPTSSQSEEPTSQDKRKASPLYPVD